MAPRLRCDGGINADSSERLSRLWILLQFNDMTLRLFAICLRFQGVCLGDEAAFGAGRDCCGELVLGSEHVLDDDPDVESMSEQFVELCRFRVEMTFCRNFGRFPCGQMKVWFGDAM